MQRSGDGVECRISTSPGSWVVVALQLLGVAVGSRGPGEDIKDTWRGLPSAQYSVYLAYGGFVLAGC